MKTATVGRNDPCPCGSGKKYKNCCLGKDEPVISAQGAAEASETLRRALEKRQFDSMEEAQAFLEQQTQQQNRKALDDFHGLSPEQMHHLLHFPFTSPQLVRFPEVLDSAPTAPLLTLFELLTGAIGTQGLKPTAKGNLPHEFYEDSFLRAFPLVLNEVPPEPYIEPEKACRNCYTWRTLVHFAGFLGLAEVEPIAKERLCHQYRVRALPLLGQTVQFQLSE